MVRYIVLALGAEEGFQLVSVKNGNALQLAVSCHCGLPTPTVVKVPRGVLVDDKAAGVSKVDGIMKSIVLVGDERAISESNIRAPLSQIVGNFAAKLVAIRPARKRKYRRKGYVAHRDGQEYVLPPLRKQKKV